MVEVENSHCCGIMLPKLCGQIKLSMTDIVSDTKYDNMMPQQCEFPMVEVENENGWGPSEPLANLMNLPLAGYAAKNDSLFQVADWYNTRKFNRRDMQNTVNKEFESLKQDKDFNYVASEPKKKKTTRKSHTAIQKARQARQQAKHENQFKFEQSVQVQSTWGHKDDKWLPDMKEYAYELNEDTYKVSKLEEIGRCKTIRKNLKKIRVDAPRPLKHKNRITRRKWVSTLQDEVLKTHEAEGDVFISSEILAALMVAPRSKMSWDIFVTKREDGKLWFDMRQESPLQKQQQ